MSAFYPGQTSQIPPETSVCTTRTHLVSCPSGHDSKNRWELRKLEFYRDGRVGKASKDGSTLDTALGIESLPAIEEINGDRQFPAMPIEHEAFQALWLAQGHGQDNIG